MAFTGSPADNPAFLDPERAEAIGYIGADTVPKFDSELAEMVQSGMSDDCDGVREPSPGIRSRRREIARLNALGYTNNEICTELGYTPSWVSTVLKDPFIQKEVAYWRDLLIDADTAAILKTAGRDAAMYLVRTLRDPKVKDEIKSGIAKFMIEKETGKARQETHLEIGGLSEYMRIIKDLDKRGGIVDVSPEQLAAPQSAESPAQRDAGQSGTTTEGPDRWTTWLNSNL